VTAEYYWPSENIMLVRSHESTVASVFAPRTAIGADGTVEGYASLFGEVDQARDMVMRGAFAETLRLRGIRRIPMLFQHDPSEPVGIWLELREDHRGLYARGQLIPEVARARELHGLLKAQAIDGLSIGFRTVKGRIDPKTRIRRLHAVELWEISIVTFPLLAGARVHAVKQAASSPPRASFARTRAEQEWKAVIRNASTRRPEMRAAKAASLEGRRPSSFEARFARTSG
jgi:HK97 family phage prohead protease